MSLGNPLLDAFDRPLLRRPLGIILAARRSRQFGRKVNVGWLDGRWHYEVDGRTLVPELHGWIDPLKWDNLAKDVFFHYYRPKPNDLIIDIGAGIGTELFSYSELLAGRGTVYALEAHPATFEKLKCLVDLNHGISINCNIFVECLAVGDRQGTALISNDENHVGNTIFAEEGVPTEITTLDDYIRDHEIKQIDFLKMNIEGAERQALIAAEEALSITVNGAISCHDFKADYTGDDRFRTKAFVKTVLLKAGFEVRERPDAADPWTRDYLYVSRE